jgi:NAD-dependent dihydropyrimidine dehydrogenase PreA subunit
MRQHRHRGRQAPQGPRSGWPDEAARCGEPGKVVPQVDRNRCEGKDDCVRVCPYSVFELRRIDSADFSGLTFRGKVRSLLHGGVTAYTPAADACRACGLCVRACPENAIRLVKNPAAAEGV